jgi:ubiquinone/menaquinone biosynthesis C-methylase UbiE
MPTEKQVYDAHADQYERLIRREDWQNNIEKAIEQILLPDGLDIVDLGAGTGRLTRLLAPRARTIHAFDASAHMLAETEASLRGTGLSNWKVGVADHRQIPLTSESVDLVVSGWSFCYLAVWGGEEWKSALEAGLAEIQRILRPGGTVILFETMGTGQEFPNPPVHLSGYYAWLAEKGFQSTWIRTDYKFESLAEAEELAMFFFGEQMGKEIRAKNWQVLPECTGVWWRTKSA